MGHEVQLIQGPCGMGDNSQERHQCKLLGVDISSGLSCISHMVRITVNANWALGF